MDELKQHAADNLAKLRLTKPLIHNITNYVVMNYTANALLAMGAQPVMAHAENEVRDMVKLARCLVINIGTLSDHWIRAMKAAGEEANSLDIPIILDPVGSGATPLRTETARMLAHDLKLAVIRGNASEILSLAGDEAQTRGVDSVHSVEHASRVAFNLAQRFKTIVAVTGKVDLITDGDTSCRIHNGHPLMGRVTGTGCTATAAIAAFCAVNRNYLEAASFALGYFGLAGECAAESSIMPGSYGIALLDQLYAITPEILQSGIKIEV